MTKSIISPAEVIATAFADGGYLAPDAISDAHKRTPPGSIAFVPSAAGLLMASEILQILLDPKEGREREDV